MDDSELLRYSRQIMLPDVDIGGQERLREAHVAIVGVGGLGSPAALYLAAAGVGQLTLIDDDAVDLSNLQRQIAHDTDSIGTNKATSAASRLGAINPHTQVTVCNERLDAENGQRILTDVDLLLDCTDNYTTRTAINMLCWTAKVPVVSGAAIRWEGQLSVFDANTPESPCYRCLYPDDDGTALNCAENGVIAPLVGIIGTHQAMEAVKYLMGVGEPLIGRVLYYDAKYAEWRSLKLNRRNGCPVCGTRSNLT